MDNTPPEPPWGYGTLVPQVPPGTRGDGGARVDRGVHDTTTTHTAAVTPEFLRPCLDRRGIGTPRGGFWAHREVPPPHSGGYTRVPSVLPGPRRDRDAPWGFEGTLHCPPPHSGGYTRVPPVLPGPRRDRGPVGV